MLLVKGQESDKRFSQTPTDSDRLRCYGLADCDWPFDVRWPNAMIKQSLGLMLAVCRLGCTAITGMPRPGSAYFSESEAEPSLYYLGSACTANSDEHARAPKPCQSGPIVKKVQSVKCRMSRLFLPLLESATTRSSLAVPLFGCNPFKSAMDIFTIVLVNRLVQRISRIS